MNDKLPTVRQMACRALSGHRAALHNLANGLPVVRPNAFASEIRGMQTVMSTLRGWGCIDGAGELTATGRELLAVLESRRRH